MKIAISQILALQRNDFRILMMRNPLAVSETERPLKAYLDYNMFRYLESGKVTLEQIKERLGWTGEIIFPFTSAHIQEVDAIPDDNPKRNEIINKRLEFFDSITNGYYLDNELDEPDRFTHWTRSGFTQYDTITEVPFAKEQMKMLANFVTKDQRKAVLDYMVEQTGVDPVRVNNYTVPQVMEHLEKLAKGAQMTFVEFIAKVESFNPSIKKYGLTHHAAMLFELLDMVGYWKDTFTENSNYARLWDASHVAFACTCDCFITNDKRTANKAQVFYGMYDIGTVVVLWRNHN